MTDRRDFLGSLLALGAVPTLAKVPHSPAAPQGGSAWNVAWADKLTGKHKMVFDSPEISQGLALLRALIWIKDYGDVYKAPASDMNAVVVLRHNAIWMVMNDEFWNHHDIGAKTGIKDPKTGAPIKRNPVLGPTPWTDLPPQVADNALTKALAATTILACNLAFQEVVEVEKAEAKVDDARARAMAISHIVPGIILQPSGAFALSRAQEAGCHYMNAS
ncbi:MAG: hypothetical protein HOP28_14340 [Gemmatimonadales bacterium]|nr:hypothetical protein [Gemmatimonadales bacterium]